MKGLLMKDMLLLKKSSKSFLILILIFGVIGFQDNQNQMSVSLIPIVGMLTLSLFTYDVFSKFSMFAMTLPISKRSYVLSRYMTGGILIITGIIPTLLIFLLKYIFGQRVVPSFVIEGISLAVLLSLIVLAIAIPLFYKYSPEVARTYFLIGIFIVGFGLPFLFSQLNLSIHLSLVNLFIFLIVITIVALLLSIHLSIKIFSKKILLN